MVIAVGQYTTHGRPLSLRDTRALLYLGLALARVTTRAYGSLAPAIAARYAGGAAIAFAGRDTPPPLYFARYTSLGELWCDVEVKSVGKILPH